MLLDYHIKYTWLYPCCILDMEKAPQAIIDWSVTFGPPSSSMSDVSSHFENEVMCFLVKMMEALHRFTQIYCLCSNEEIERLKKMFCIYFEHFFQGFNCIQMHSQLFSLYFGLQLISPLLCNKKKSRCLL